MPFLSANQQHPKGRFQTNPNSNPNPNPKSYYSRKLSAFVFYGELKSFNYVQFTTHSMISTFNVN